MLQKITPDEISQVYQKAKARGLINEEDTAVVFYSLDLLKERLKHLREVFPSGTKHAIAIKTHPSKGILNYIIKEGYGLEAASWEEMKFARECGLYMSKAVFDSPAKTHSEIRECEKQFPGSVVNANCLEELERYDPESSLRLGLRINPEINIDAPDIYNVSTHSSKFGEPLSNKGEIIKAALKKPLIQGLHIHSGSDVHNFENNVQAILKVKKLADEINLERRKKNLPDLSYIDIGGGINGSQDAEGKYVGLKPYADRLKEICPSLFEKYEIITEFGRFVHADNAFVISNIEYILKGKIPTAIIHVGADMFVRQSYSIPTDYEVTVLDPGGKLRSSENTSTYNIAGPLCFSGDYVFKNKEIPTIEVHDQLCINGIGANTTALWSRHCSRNIPKTIAYSLIFDNFEVLNTRTSTAFL